MSLTKVRTLEQTVHKLLIRDQYKPTNTKKKPFQISWFSYDLKIIRFPLVIMSISQTKARILIPKAL